MQIRKTVRHSLPPVPYQSIARKILGPSYELSLVICGDGLARRMYRKYRAPALRHPEQSKTYASNVLSFPYDTHSGEIFLNANKAAREARRLGTTHRARLALLFAHGCCHLKGLPHGKQMDALTERVLRYYGLSH